MPESRQHLQRLDAWCQELRRQIFEPCGTVSFRGHCTMERLTPGQAVLRPSFPVPPGTHWGKYREYGWFSAKISVPAAWKKRRLVLHSGIGGEQLVYINGKAAGSIDKQHTCLTLSRHAEQGMMDILIESYAGNGARLENYGPCPPERQPLPETEPCQCCVKESSLSLVCEEAYQLFMDVDTLLQLSRTLSETSLRRMKIAEALDSFTHTVDFELPRRERMETYQRAREMLRPLLACRNGDTVPEFHILGQSHIDLAWLWPMEETFHKAVRTYSNQLALMDEYEEYRFLACEPALLEMLQESDPEVFQRLMGKIKNGQAVPDGAFYVECDTNIPSGESLIRQLKLGTEWFREHTGTDSHVAWQPDTFGFSPCLPQLLRGFGVTYFATQKLLRADPECERFPFQDFIWEGTDGSCVQALCFYKNNARTDPENLSARWEKHRSQTDHIQSLLYPFGYGDGGGGADRDMLEYLRREQDLEGLPRTVWSTLEDHFLKASQSAAKNRYRGELYLAWHRGTYTVQRNTKVALRELEQALHDTELLLAMCGPQTRSLHTVKVKKAWKVLLLHQFHDIAAGVGIRDVHTEAVQALKAQTEELREALPLLAREAFHVEPSGDTVTVFNPLPFRYMAFLNIQGHSGYVSLPASGAKSFRASDLERINGTVSVHPCDSGYLIDNGCLRFILTREGAITALSDLRLGISLQDTGMRMNDFRIYRNVEPVYDAWELSKDYIQDREDTVKVTEILLSGEDTSCLRITVSGMVGSSPCTEKIVILAMSPEITFETDIDWRERHKLLKVHFESNIQAEHAVHEMQFCHISRPAHRTYGYAMDRYEVCQHHYSALFEGARGFAILNRAIYGVSCDKGDLALTLLRAPCVPDDTCDRGHHHFSFALHVYSGPFSVSSVTEDGYCFNRPPLMLSGRCSQTEGFWAEHAMIETIKPAENKDGIILRAWEYRGSRCMAVFHLPRLYAVYACSLSESDLKLISVSDTFSYELRSFGIQTFFLAPPEQAAP